MRVGEKRRKGFRRAGGGIAGIGSAGNMHGIRCQNKKTVAITNITPLMGAPDAEKEDVVTLKKAVKDFIAKGAS